MEKKRKKILMFLNTEHVTEITCAEGSDLNNKIGIFDFVMVWVELRISLIIFLEKKYTVYTHIYIKNKIYLKFKGFLKHQKSNKLFLCWSILITK